MVSSITTDSDSTTDHKEEEEGGLKVLEELTRNASQIQDQLLLNILSQNANTEYLLRFHLMNHHHLDPINNNNIKQVFKERVPVVVYEDIKPYIQRIASGQPSHIISAQPITELLTRQVHIYIYIHDHKQIH